MTSVRAGVARSEGVLQLDLARARDVAREILARGGVARGAAFDLYVCDMNVAPGAAVELLAQSLPLLRPRAAVVVTMKVCAGTRTTPSAARPRGIALNCERQTSLEQQN